MRPLRTLFVLGLTAYVTFAGVQGTSYLALSHGSSLGTPFGTVAYGIDAYGARHLPGGVKPNYGTIWIGAWTAHSGWNYLDGEVAALRDAGITRAIQFYYWGDDISQACLEQGCAGKSKAQWFTLADQLGARLNAGLGTRSALVIVETEFNKNDATAHETLDGDMADIIGRIKAGHPAAHVGIGFGNWNPDWWPLFDRAAAAGDFVGLQSLVSFTRHTQGDHERFFGATLQGAGRLSELFQKPVVLDDVGISTWPEPGGLDWQAQLVGQFVDGEADLWHAGVSAVLYRSWQDAAGMPLEHYFGEGERHFGLAWSDGRAKPAGETWLARLNREVGAQ